MTVIRGTLTGATPLDGYGVTAFFDERVALDGEDEFVASRREATLERDGSFFVELPDAEGRQGLIELTAFGPDGLAAGATTVPEEGPFDGVVIEVRAVETTEVVTSPEITLGEQVKFTGRVIDPSGRGAPAGLLVVIWARKSGSEEPSPLSVTTTSAGGYFSAPWPSDVIAEPFAVVSGSDPIPIAVVEDRLPLRIVLVLDEFPEPAATDDDCACDDAPPRAPDAVDVAENPEAFAADAERCVDFTVPNRAVEEVTYQAVVRTTQPQLKAATPPRRPSIPGALIDRLVALAQLRPVIADSAGRSVSVEAIGRTEVPDVMIGRNEFASATPQPAPELSLERLIGDEGIAGEAVRVARRLIPGVDLDGSWRTPAIPLEARAIRVLDERVADGQPLRLETSVLAELAKESGELTATRLIEAEQTSVVRRFRSAVGLLAKPSSGRYVLDSDHQIDWDEIPDPYQATTIAHGHLLTLKQVWRADGYSLGDLLYSLPLAPGQQKLISVLDWNRQEVASRRAERVAAEELEAELAHDRDVSDVIRTTLTERMNASSHADVEAVGGGIGGFIGPFVFGAAGGVSSAGSTASQTSARSVTGMSLNRLRDRTLQAASAVRNQRATVVQTARQGESVRAMTEVVANYNHCHAMTVEYFEVLRHFQVSQELAAVQECLFVPFSISPFTTDKALRWRLPLGRRLRQRRLRWAFDALERVRTDWEDADYPLGRYADEPLVHLDGEFWIRVTLPRPADDDDDNFVLANWQPYEDHLWDDAEAIWERYLGVALPEDRDAIWDARIAPGVAQRLLEELDLDLVRAGGLSTSVGVDATLVSRFAQNRRLLVSLRTETPLPVVLRSSIERVRLSLDVSNLPPGAEMVVDSGTMRYRTDHLTYHLFLNRRVLNDLTLGDDVEIATPLSLYEKRNPRERDRRYAERLLDHLNEHVEYYHRAIWLTMDPNRRYLLLDGFIAPDAGGRSVASVVENRIIGVVGNSLVMPVAPGQQLDTTYEFAEATPEDLRHLYAGDAAPPMRISVPTSGVFAEAVLGQCNSCEVIDDTRFWRFEEEPIPDRPPSIEALSTASRRTTPPSLTPDAFPEPIVQLQEVPTAPDPTGLAAAAAALGTNNIFRDLTGLALNQENAAAAFASSVKAAQGFASQAGALAQQRFLNRELDRSLANIKEARDKQLISEDAARNLTESAIRGAIGEKRPTEKSAVEAAAVKRAIERLPKATKGVLRVTRPEGSVELKTGEAAGRQRIDVKVDPEVQPVQQRSNLTCWATGAVMMESWRTQTSISEETLLDSLGGEWRGKFDRNEGLTVAELRAFLAALSLTEEGAQSYTPDGLARLIAEHGPGFEVADDAIENNLLVHVRIITGVAGDGTPGGTEVTLVDTASGRSETQSFTEFDRRHSSADAAGFGVGILHY